MVTFVGTPVIGSPLTTTFVAPATMHFQTYYFTGFDNLTSVSWAHVFPYNQYDNITLDVPQSTTPEPATVVLLGAGLVVLVSTRHRARHA